jgi:hypothetical protein
LLDVALDVFTKKLFQAFTQSFGYTVTESEREKKSATYGLSVMVKKKKIKLKRPE